MSYIPVCRLLLLVLLLPLPMQGQGLQFPRPVTTGALNHRDAAAFAEITAHLNAVGATNWQDLEAAGTISFPAGDSHNATLYLLGSEGTRLDITFDSSVRSLRDRGFVGEAHGESGDTVALPPTAALAGVLAFPRLWSEASSAATVSLYDHGNLAVGGTSLHRITMEYAPSAGFLPYGGTTVATDLYFEPHSHLLVYSVDSIPFSTTHGQPLLRITSYTAYQRFGAVLFPTSFQQILNGQLQWTLELSQFKLNQNLPLSTFSF